MAQDQRGNPMQANDGATTLVERLEALSARIPGVVGYRQREASRETDRSVRLRLAAGLEDLKRQIEREQQRRTEEHEFIHLAGLGRLTSKLDKLSNLVRFASRGYRGLFDADKLNDDKLQRLYGFDVALLDQIESLRNAAALVCGQQNDEPLAQGISQLDHRLDEFESIFSQRASVLSSE